MKTGITRLVLLLATALVAVGPVQAAPSTELEFLGQQIFPTVDPVPGHDVRRPLQHRVRREPRRLLRPLRRPGQRAFLHAADRRRGRCARGRDRRRDHAARRRRSAVRAAQPRSGRAGADEGRHARDHVRGLRGAPDRPLGAGVRARRTPARRAAAAVGVPAERGRHARRPPEPRLRERRDAAERPLPLHRDRERARPGRAAGDGRRREPGATAALQPPAGRARPPVRLLDGSDRRAARAREPVRGQRPRRGAAAEQPVHALDGALVLGRRARAPGTRSSSTTSRCPAPTTSTASTASRRCSAASRQSRRRSCSTSTRSGSRSTTSRG